MGRDRAADRRQSGTAIHAPLGLVALLLLTGVILPARLNPPRSLAAARAENKKLQSQLEQLTTETRRLETRLLQPDPDEVYIVVDTGANRLYLYRGNELVREAVVSTGSGKVLTTPAQDHWWVFETPRGVRQVLGKQEKPVWYKPDWAFLEEGLPVPPHRDPSRIVRGILGAYALDLGDQVKIHGTTEKDRLGESVSHGCVRVGDEDLEAIYQITPVGARVFFY